MQIINSIDLLTEQYKNHYECFNGAFVDEFEKGMIRKFIEDSHYDNIIKKAVENHSRLEIEENLDERTLLHSKIIRDADKIDNYRVKKDECLLKIKEVDTRIMEIQANMEDDDSIERGIKKLKKVFDTIL